MNHELWIQDLLCISWLCTETTRQTCESDALAQQHTYSALLENIKPINVFSNDLTKVYPNPANRLLSIQYPNCESEFIMYDLFGNVVLKKKLEKDRTTQTILLPKLASAVYKYKIVCDNSTYYGKLKIEQND